MPRAIYEKFEVSCWGEYVIQFASEATVGNVMSEINRVRLGQPFGRFFSHNETGCQATCVQRHCPPGAQRGRRGPARVTPAPAQPDSLIGSVFPSPPKHRPVSRSTGVPSCSRANRRSPYGREQRTGDACDSTERLDTVSSAWPSGPAHAIRNECKAHVLQPMTSRGCRACAIGIWRAAEELA
ncbi:hypothetical protein PG988_006563 [Apiospora saccharicola]